MTKLLKIYLWAGANQNNRCKVARDQCCEKNEIWWIRVSGHQRMSGLALWNKVRRA